MFSWFGKVSYVPYSKVSDFAVHLKDGRLMGSRCKACGLTTFPPRADCPECSSGHFGFAEYSGKGTVYTHTTIAAAPTGFEDVTPYTVVVVDLVEGGRLLGWLGQGIPAEDLRDLEATEARPEEHEVFEASWSPLEEAVALAAGGKLHDAKTLIGGCSGRVTGSASPDPAGASRPG